MMGSTTDAVCARQFVVVTFQNKCLKGPRVPCRKVYFAMMGFCLVTSR